jgi:1,2-diacylglycerol 3-beta-glucosyltransferase
MARRRFWRTSSGIGFVCCCYYGALLIAARRSSHAPPLTAASGEVLTLVPAHDEESTIARCVHSLTQANSHVVVIADHCSDGTADAARAAGARVLEHSGRQSSTKAAAVGYAISELRATLPEAVAIVDADCVVTSNFSEVVLANLRLAPACQVDNRVRNPEASVIAGLRFASYAIIHHVRPKGKTALGLSAGVFGTGIALSRETALSVPWSSRSTAEDRLYHLELVRRGGRVLYDARAAVLSDAAITSQQSHRQQQRWESAHLESLLPSLALAVEGSRRRDRVRAHAGIESFIPGQSLLGVLLVASFLSGRSRRERSVASVLLLAQLGFIVDSLRAAGAPRSVYRSLLASPLQIQVKLRVTSMKVLHQSRVWYRARP